VILEDSTNNVRPHLNFISCYEMNGKGGVNVEFGRWWIIIFSYFVIFLYLSWSFICV